MNRYLAIRKLLKKLEKHNKYRVYDKVSNAPSRIRDILSKLAGEDEIDNVRREKVKSRLAGIETEKSFRISP